MRYRKKKTFGKIISFILITVVALGAITGITSLMKNRSEDDSKRLYPIYSIGGLNEEGKTLTTDKTIYTKNSFECDGLEIKLDFDSNVKYQVFFYDELDKFISASPIYEESMKPEIPENAKLARLVVEPIWDEDISEEDRCLTLVDVLKYANQLKVIVFKEQKSVASSDVVIWEDLGNYDLTNLSVAQDKKITGLHISNAGFIYKNNTFENKTITKIGLPVKRLNDITTDCFYTVSVIKESTSYTSVDVVETYILPIRANTFTVSGDVNEWVYFDVNIPVGENETLMFGSVTDSITVYYDRFVNDSGLFIDKANTENAGVAPYGGSLLFDIYVEED